MRFRRFLLQYYPPTITCEHERSAAHTRTQAADNSGCDDGGGSIAGAGSSSTQATGKNTEAETGGKAIVRRSTRLWEHPWFQHGPPAAWSQPQLDAAVRQVVADCRLGPKAAAAVPRLVQHVAHAQVVGRKTFRRTVAWKPHPHPLCNAVLDPWDHAGAQLLTVSYDRTGRVWQLQDVAAGSRGFVSLAGHSDIVSCGAFIVPKGSSNRRVATGSFDQSVRVWNAETGDCLHTLTGHRGRVVAVRSSFHVPNALISSSIDGTARLWDAATGATIMVLGPHSGGVTAVQWAGAQSQYLVSGGFDGRVLLWDAAGRTRQPIHQLWASPAGSFAAPIASIAVPTVAGDQVYVGSTDGAVRGWHLPSTKPLWTHSRQAEVSSLHINAAGSQLCAAYDNGDIGVIRSANGDTVFSMSSAHRGGASDVVFNGPGTRLLSGGADGAVRLWDADQGQLIQELKCHDADVFSVQFGRIPRSFITASTDSTVTWWTSGRRGTKPRQPNPAVSTGAVTTATRTDAPPSSPAVRPRAHTMDRAVLEAELDLLHDNY